MEEKTSSKKYKRVCCLCSLSNQNVTDDSIIFHNFPKNDVYFKEWMKHCGIDFMASKAKRNGRLTICSLHFAPNDYLPIRLEDGSQGRSKTLKHIAVPTVFNAPVTPNEKSITSILNRLKKQESLSITTLSNNQELQVNQMDTSDEYGEDSEFDPTLFIKVEYYSDEESNSVENTDSVPNEHVQLANINASTGSKDFMHSIIDEKDISKWPKEELYKCEWEGCNYSNRTKRNLTVHTKTHTATKPYKCDYSGCNACFQQSGSLMRHKRLHTGEKPHKCDYSGCEAAFIQSGDLKKHKLKHTGEKPYSCDYSGCRAAFTQSCHLKCHKLKHTGVKPYKCDYSGCQAAYVQSSHLKSHKLKHTGENVT